MSCVGGKESIHTLGNWCQTARVLVLDLGSRNELVDRWKLIIGF